MMPVNEIYKSASDLPRLIPVFPLSGALLLPRTQLPLNIFEPRYLAMPNDAISGERVIGMVQPGFDVTAGEVDNAAAHPDLQPVGCVGRVTSFAETGDGRILITLTGICRFELVRELPLATAYRRFEVDYARFDDDLDPQVGEAEVDRDGLLEALKAYLEANKLEADWESLNEATNDTLVNGLCVMAPYGPKEKQALLEAADLKTRAEMLVAMTEMALAGAGSETSTTMQ